MTNLKNRLKKGFTLTELAVVIAVIAILVAVLVPTFISLINSAQESSDMQLVNNLNTSLSIAGEPDTVETDDGTVYNVTTAITSVRGDGYDVSKITPTADGGDIVYNATKNKFVYYADDFKELAYGDVDSGDVLVVVDADLSRVSVAQSASLLSDHTVQYCVYSEDAVTISTSENISIWVYTENGTSTITAASSVVYRYGTGEKDVAAVDSSSYHLYGKVNTIVMEQGHLDVKNEDSVTDVILSVTTTGNQPYVTGSAVENLVIDTTSGTTYTKEKDNKVTATNTIKKDENLSDIEGYGTATNPYVVESTSDLTTILSSNSGNITISVADASSTITVADDTITISGSLSEAYYETVVTVAGNSELSVDLDNEYRTYVSSDGTKIVSYTDAAANAVARIGTVYYADLTLLCTYSSPAYKLTVGSGAEITLLKNVSLSYQIKVAYGDTYTIDLNGYELSFSGSYYINNLGNLTLSSSQEGGTISAGTSYVLNCSTTSASKQINLTINDNVIIDSGTSTYTSVYLKYTTAVINSCTMKRDDTEKYSLQLAEGTNVTINNITCEGKIAVNNNATSNPVLNINSSLYTSGLTIYTGTNNCNIAVDTSTEGYYTYTSIATVMYIEHDGVKTYYANLNSAIQLAENGDTIVLQQNCTSTSSLTNYLTGDVTIDLNGYELDCTYSSSNYVKNGYSLTIKNGTWVHKGITGTTAVFVVSSGSALNFDTVTFECDASAVLVQGDNATLNVTNSTIKGNGSYAISTNAGSSDNYGVVISIESSTIYGGICGILLNVPGEMSITGSTITGANQAVIVRAGTATIANTTLESELTDSDTWKAYDETDWNSGSEVAVAVLVIGSRSGTYAGDAVVTLDDVTFSYDSSVDGAKAVYMYGGVVYNTTGSEEANKAILYYDSKFDTSLVTKGGDEQYIVVEAITE